MHQMMTTINAYDKSSKFTNCVRKINGPAYYSFLDNKNSFYIVTSIEDRKRHQAIIYKSDNFGKDWYQFAEFNKDTLPSKLFGYGVIDFWSVDNSSQTLNLRLKGLGEVSV